MEYKQGSDLKNGIYTLLALAIPDPAYPPVNADAPLTQISENQINLYAKKVDQLESSIQSFLTHVGVVHRCNAIQS